jgi:hypothetical protein
MDTHLFLLQLRQPFLLQLRPAHRDLDHGRLVLLWLPPSMEPREVERMRRRRLGLG